MIRLLTVALLAASFSVVADVTLTDINNNEVADAEVVMGNFNALKQGVKANATAIDALPTPPSDCLTNQIIKWNGSAWVCATDSLASLSCEEGQTITYRNGAWQCAGCVAPGRKITDSNFNAAITDWFDRGNDSDYGPISQWCTGNVTNMREAFSKDFNFNEDISAWDTSNVTNMGGMFYDATAFNQDISGWDTSSVADMSYMFGLATAFNRVISGWDTSNVAIMFAMFDGATAFNQDLSSWDASSVTDCVAFANSATAWLAAYSGSIAGKTPPLSASMIDAGCGN